MTPTPHTSHPAAANLGRQPMVVSTGAHTHGMVKLALYQAATIWAVPYPDAGACAC